MVNDATRPALELLMQSCLVFSVAVLAVALLRPLCLRWLGAAAAYGSWLLLPVALLAQALPPAAQEPAALATVTTLATSAPITAPLAMAPAPVAPLLSPAQSLALLALWAAGSLLCGGFMRVQQGRLQRSLVRSGEGWRSPAGSSPALVGCWPQRLALPEDFEQRFDAKEQALILAHEQVHARRHDNRWNLLAAALLALQWFNPLAWWAWRRMRADQELACDAAVLREADAALPSYTSALLKSCHAEMRLGLSSRWGLRHPLLERVRLLKARTPATWARRASLPLLMALGAGTGLLVQAAAPLLPTLPADAASPASPVPEGPLVGVQLELRTQQAQGQALGAPLKLGFSLQDWRPQQTYQGITYRMPQEGWCLEFMLYALPDGELRPHVGMLDAECRRDIAATAPLDVGGKPTLLQQTGEHRQAPRQVQLRMSWLHPHSAEFAQLRNSTRLRPNPALQAQDAVWRRARGEASSTPAAVTAAPTRIAVKAQAEQISAQAPAEPQIEVRMAIELIDMHEGKERQLRSQPTLRLAPGKPGTVMLRGSPTQPTADQVAIEVWVRDLGDSKVEIRAEIKKGLGLETVSKPRLITKDGMKARIELGREGPSGDKDMLSIDVTPTVLGQGQAGA